jgi:hypothetical protein
MYIYTMPTIIKLYGVVSHVGVNSILLGGHNDSIIKLRKLKYPGKNPLTNTNKFYVVFKEEVVIPLGVIGEKVTVWVRVKKYKFHSTYEKNKGELVEGWKLHLVKIEKNGDWS